MVEVFNKKDPKAGVIDKKRKDRILGEIIFDNKKGFKIHSSNRLFSKSEYIWTKVP